MAMDFMSLVIPCHFYMTYLIFVNPKLKSNNVCFYDKKWLFDTLHIDNFGFNTVKQVILADMFFPQLGDFSVSWILIFVDADTEHSSVIVLLSYFEYYFLFILYY